MTTALARGLLRYCPICDGYEVTDKRVGVIGTGDHGTREALFLRGYTRDVTLIAPGAAHDLDAGCRRRLDEAGIAHVDGPCTPIRISGDADRRRHGPWRSLRSTASIPRSVPASAPASPIDAGARASEDGCLEVDAHQRTSMPGLFAAGDVVKGLDQISHAMGEAGVAATTIRNLPRRAAAAQALTKSRGHDQPVGIPFGHRFRPHRHHEALAVGPFDLDHVARAEILDRDDRAERLAVGRDRRQAEQVGVIIFALAERRQRGARHGQLGAAQRLGGGAVGDLGEARDRAVAAVGAATSASARRR